MSSVESVLWRSRTLDDPPYSGVLELAGFEVGLRVHGKVTGERSYKTTISATDPLIAADDIPTTTPDGDYITAIDEDDFLPKAPRANSLPELFHPSIDGTLCVFTYDEFEYIVGPMARKVYDFKIAQDVTVTLRSDNQTVPPIEFSLDRVSGTLTGCGNDSYQFKEETDGILENLLASNESLNGLKLREARNIFSITDLSTESVVTTDSHPDEHLVPCQFTATDTELRVEATVSDENVVWKVPIDEFGQLPKAAKEAFELNSLYLTVKQNDTSFVQVRPANYGEDGIQVSVDNKYFLESFE